MSGMFEWDAASLGAFQEQGCPAGNSFSELNGQHSFSFHLAYFYQSQSLLWARLRQEGIEIFLCTDLPYSPLLIRSHNEDQTLFLLRVRKFPTGIRYVVEAGKTLRDYFQGSTVAALGLDEEGYLTALQALSAAVEEIRLRGCCDMLALAVDSSTCKTVQ